MNDEKFNLKDNSPSFVEKSYSSYYSYSSSPETPVYKRKFSKEESNKFKNQASQLKLDIESLQKHLDKLKKTIAKRSIVSNSAFIKIDAETKNGLSKNHSNQIIEKIDEYIATVHNQKAMHAEIEMFDEELNEEKNKRLDCDEEMKMIKSLFDFSSYQSSEIPLHCLKFSQKTKNNDEIDHCLDKLVLIKKDLKSIEDNKQIDSLQREAAQLCANNCNTQLKSQSFKINLFKSDISHYQQLTKESEISNQHLELQVQKMRNQLQQIQAEDKQNESSFSSKLKLLKEQFEKDNTILDDKKLQIQSEIDNSASSYDNVIQEITEIRSETEQIRSSSSQGLCNGSHQRSYSNNSNSPEISSEDKEDFFEQGDSQNEEEDIFHFEEEEEGESEGMLKTKKNQLQLEISQLKKDIHNKKKTALKNQARLENQIRHLKTKINNLRRQIQIKIFEKSNSMQVKGEIFDVINNIHELITDLKD